MLLSSTYILWDVQETAFPASVTIKRMNVKASVVLSTYVDCRLMAVVSHNSSSVQYNTPIS